MGTVKDRSSTDLIEAENIKKRWQECTEELYKKNCTLELYKKNYTLSWPR